MNQCPLRFHNLRRLCCFILHKYKQSTMISVCRRRTRTSRYQWNPPTKYIKLHIPRTLLLVGPNTIFGNIKWTFLGCSWDDNDIFHLFRANRIDTNFRCWCCWSRSHWFLWIYLRSCPRYGLIPIFISNIWFGKSYINCIDWKKYSWINRNGTLTI